MYNVRLPQPYVAPRGGSCISCYSLVDKRGVSLAHPIHYIVGMKLVTLAGLVPYLALHGPESRMRCVSAWRTKKRYMVVVGLGLIPVCLLRTLTNLGSR